ncbi:MAG TPA: lytic murein transglycosylase [Candidatus Acidoferrales bacterium]|nr:lytic murein transglycosylase [Candidatus Acidoferrales bacterium]
MLRVRSLWVVLGAGLCLPSLARADASGWSYLIDRLIADGISPVQVRQTFDDPRLPAFDGLEFAPERRHESKNMYRRFLKPASAAAARRCRQENAAELEAAERREGVPANVIAAILYVETGCGRNTGSHRIFYRLARLAMADEPQNFRQNLRRVCDEGSSDDLEAKMRARARYLDETFYPEVRACFEVAHRLGVAPLDLRGSISGAFGYPQFLPTSYLRHGVDADHDGRVSLTDPADAAASCARYLASNGWQAGMSQKQRRQVIWTYNRSDAYIDTVLTLAARIDQPVVLARARKPAASHKKPPSSPKKRRS